MGHVTKRCYMKHTKVQYKKQAEARNAYSEPSHLHKAQVREMAMRDDILAYYHDNLNH